MTHITIAGLARLKQRLRRAGISHARVAASAGVERSLVTHVLAGRAKSRNVVETARRLLAEGKERGGCRDTPCPLTIAGLARLKQRLRRAGISHARVAASAGVERSLVTHVLAGRAKSRNVVETARRLLAEGKERAA